MLLDIREHRNTWHDLVGAGTPSVSISPKEIKLTRDAHSLTDLRDTIASNLQILGFSALPACFYDATDIITQLECGSPSRFRYALTQRNDASFGGPTVAPIKKLHTALCSSLEQYAVRDNAERNGSETFCEEFFDEYYFYDQIRANLLHSLLDGSLAADGGWKQIPSRPLRHKPIGRCEIAYNEVFLQTERPDGRTLMILALDVDRAQSPTAFALARLGESDELSTIEVLDDHELFLVKSAAISAGLIPADLQPDSDGEQGSVTE